MARRYENSTPRTYLKINKDGVLYTSSRTATETSVEITLRDGTKAYHELYPMGTDIGHILYIKVQKDGKYGKELHIAVKAVDSNNVDVIQIPLTHPKGMDLSGYASSFASILPNIDFSRSLYIDPSKQKNSRDYVFQSFNIAYLENNVDGSWEPIKRYWVAPNKEGSNADIANLPALEIKESLDGSAVYDNTAAANVLMRSLKEQIERHELFVKDNPDLFGSYFSESAGADEYYEEPTSTPTAAAVAGVSAAKTATVETTKPVAGPKLHTPAAPAAPAVGFDNGDNDDLPF